MASLLDSGQTNVPVEFVQGSCDQPQSYEPHGSQKASATSDVLAYAQGAVAGKSSLNRSAASLQHNVVMAQSVGDSTQQHTIGAMEGGRSNASEVAVTPTVASTADLSHVLSGLQQSGELSSVLQQQPQLVEDLSAIAAGEVSMDPENLRFHYEIADESEQVTTKTSKRQKPVVYREQDRFLPIHNVARIMRNAIPRNGKVSKDAKECMQECVSEFISFITSEASDKCIAEKRKTITGDDILVAMATLGFDNYIEPLKLYLQKYREFTKAEKMAGNGASGMGTVGGQTRQTGLTGSSGQVVGRPSIGVGGADIISVPVVGGTQSQHMAAVYSNSSYGDQVQQLTNTS